jgi:alcohol dehydrogenase (cytochrome c)
VSFFPTAWNPSKKLAYGAGIEGCVQLTVDETRMGGPFWNGGIAVRGKRMGGSAAAIDMTTGQVKATHLFDYPVYSGVVATGGGVVYTATMDGTVLALDDEQLQPLWSFDVGAMICAPPMTYAVGGKQFVAIHAGCGAPYSVQILKASPELHTLEGGSTLFVFALD